MKIKPCPFCGGEASYMTYITERGVFTRSRKHIYFKCQKCEAQTKAFPESVHYSAEEKAMEAWNKRVGEGEQGKKTLNEVRAEYGLPSVEKMVL